MKVANVRFVEAPVELRGGGLKGWVSCEVDGAWRFDSLALRRTMAGKLTISFPARKDGRGVERPYIRPTSDAVRVEIESAVLEQLRAARAI